MEQDGTVEKKPHGHGTLAARSFVPNLLIFNGSSLSRGRAALLAAGFSCDFSCQTLWRLRITTRSYESKHSHSGDVHALLHQHGLPRRATGPALYGSYDKLYTY